MLFGNVGARNLNHIINVLRLKAVLTQLLLLTSLLIISRNRTRITMWIALKASKTNIMACA